MQFLTRPDLFLERNWRRYGDIFRARIRGFGTGTNVVVSNPRHVEQLFKASPNDVRLGEIAKRPLVPIAGPNSLLVLDQPEHLRHRKLLLPHFHGQRMLAYTDIGQRPDSRRQRGQAGT
ncbi:cytochrome P450 [Conexibacter sp. DBS9H8]|uniref:cytochrome P450 n=1 Tax=Conexibacter sp. DBS9H8 TaxID=2937801 RepID=UPI00200F924C|nr:cytochrome P450 [Conexibacter sp. DBS9H8]